MAIVKIIPIKNRINSAIEYITNEEKVQNKNYGSKREDLLSSLDYIEKDFKTRNKQFVTGINCNVQDAYNQMLITKQNYDKTDGILAFHIIHSYDQEKITPELAHKIGVEYAQELFGDRFEVVVATHLNTDHYHNHIIVNSVSFKDGKKFYANRESYAIMRQISNNLCKEYSLNTLKEKITKNNMDYHKYYNNYQMKNNYKNSAKHDIDLAISQAYSFIDFKELMNKLNYDVMIRYGKMSIRERSYKRNIRVERSFGEDYSMENIKRRILEERSPRVPFIEEYKFKKPTIYLNNYNRTYKKSKRKLSSWARLYYHYCFLLKAYSNNNKFKSHYESQELREEINKMDNYSRQAVFLDKNNINSYDDLENYKIKVNDDYSNLLFERKHLWNSKKKSKDIVNLEKQIADITNKLDEIRIDLKLIEDIEEKYEEVKKKTKELEKTKEQNRENKNIERKRLL